MALASMVCECESDLICDMAEYYHILDWRALPLRLAATLAAGLRDDSRVRMHFAGMRLPRETILAAASLDRLSVLVWAKTKDGERGRNRPRSLVQMLLGTEKADQYDAKDTIEEFEAARKRILEGG